MKGVTREVNEWQRVRISGGARLLVVPILQLIGFLIWGELLVCYLAISGSG